MTEQVDLDALIAEARGRVLAHGEFARRMGGYKLRLAELYAQHGELADALESTLAELRQERERAQKRAEWEAEQCQVEWEYGTALLTEKGEIWDVEPDPDLATAREHHDMCLADPSEYEPDSCIIVKRTPGREAGPWLPVDETGESK